MPDCRSLKATSHWCQSLPKAELHAHLSGSVRRSTIRTLLNRPHNESIRRRSEGLLDPNTGRSLKKCFELFPLIHSLISNPSTLHELVDQVLHDFAAEQTVYLELRTTPRASPQFSPRLYLETVLKAVKAYHDRNPHGMVCRVLVSVSRHLPVDDARNAIAITEEFLRSESQPELGSLIVGVELSGDPRKGYWKDFEPLFEECRQRLQLPVSLHFGEVLDDEEAMAMLDFKPDRVGHAVLMSEPTAERLVQMKMGVEVCLTSNLVTKSVKSVEEHVVVKRLLPDNVPFCLCTDDCGIFDTSLSAEYDRLLDSVELTRDQVAKIAWQGLELRFCCDSKAVKQMHRNFTEQLSRVCCSCSDVDACGWSEEISVRWP